MSSSDLEMLHEALRLDAQKLITAVDEPGDKPRENLIRALKGLIAALTDIPLSCCPFCRLCNITFGVCAEIWETLRAGDEASDDQIQRLKAAVQPYLPKKPATPA